MISTQFLDPPETHNQPVGTPDDLVLVRQAKNDMTAFSALYERYATQVYRYLLVRVGNVHDAQDLTSQTFMAAMKGLKSYQGQSPFPAWLLGIARNKAADLFRQRRPVFELDEAVETADSGEDMEDVIDRQMAVEKVARKLQTISPDRAEALSLRLFGGLEVAEIARIMEKQESAVRMLVFRGLRDLQAQLNVTQETM
ncbi:MAG: RNA polymerase sigma factor [Candidatus Promineifilaceae bacterium]